MTEHQPQMTNLEQSLHVLQHRQYLQEAYEPIVRAAGYKAENIAKLSADDVFMLATVIRNAVYDTAWKLRKAVTNSFELFGVVETVTVYEPNYIGALKLMGAAELLALRERLNFLPQPRRS